MVEFHVRLFVNLAFKFLEYRVKHLTVAFIWSGILRVSVNTFKCIKCHAAYTRMCE